MRDADKTKKQFINELIELRQQNAEHKQSKAELQERIHDLDKRIRELNCIYAIFHLAEGRGISLEEILQWTVDLVPQAWQYPEITCARIAIEGQNIRTGNFRETSDKQTSDIIVHGDRIGALDICYLEERPEKDEGPFVKEERSLLNAIAVQLGRIIERRRAEETFREGEERYRILVENANEAILVTQDGMLKFVNPKATQLMGYSEEELASRLLTEFIHPDDREMVAEHHAKRFREEEFPHTFRIVDRNGDIKWVELNTTPITWEGRWAALDLLTDITERKRTEAELLKVQKLESIGVLAGGIAHDFNNVLTAILGNISLARTYAETGRASDKITKRLADAERISMQAKDLTQQLLTFARGGAPIKKASSIAKLLRDSAAFASRGSNVRCEFSIPDNLWAVEMDEGQMSQVISNIIINATQAMPNGGVIRVCAQNWVMEVGDALPLEEEEYVTISVEDHGVGIPAEHLQQIFDPYFTTKQKGSGLGLASSYSIIRQHDGHIAAESQVGVGTIFHIYLPAFPEKKLIKEGVEEEPIAGAGRILVMDDEKHIRDLAAEILSSIGYEVVTTIDGAEAIELCIEAVDSGSPFDAVIMDLTIPGGMGGKETVRKLVEIDPEVKAIVSSGYSNDPVMANFREYGFKGVIAKPYEIRELSQVMHEVIMGTQES